MSQALREIGSQIQVVIVYQFKGLRTFNVTGEAIISPIVKTISSRPLRGPAHTAYVPEGWVVSCAHFLPGLTPLDYTVERQASLHAGTFAEDITLTCVVQSGGRATRYLFSGGSLEPTDGGMRFKFGTRTTG